MRPASLFHYPTPSPIPPSQRQASQTPANPTGPPLGAEQARVHSLADCATILDIFRSHGHREIDTARFYGEGSSEGFLGELDWRKRGLVMDTKYYPTAGRNMSKSDEPEGGWRHTPEHLRQNLMASLKALKADKVDMVSWAWPKRCILGRLASRSRHC